MAILSNLPRAKELLGGKGYDDNRFCQALIIRSIQSCVPSGKSRNVPISYDRALYRQRHRIDNMVGCLKDRRCLATHYARCVHTFMSAICLAATVFFWIDES